MKPHRSFRKANKVPWHRFAREIYSPVFISIFFVNACHGTILGGKDGVKDKTDLCPEGAVSETCACGGELVSDGHCCAGEHKPHPCDVPMCDLGEVLFSCGCGEEVVSGGYCCRNVTQDGACSFNVYYASSSSGNDDNAGTSSSLAWKTLDQVNAAALAAGDAVLFKRGDAWTGTITVSTSGSEGNPITYGAYGEGEKPKIFGSEVITGWAQHSGNVYMATVASDINQLFVNDERALLARYPKANHADGFADITTVNSTTQFVSAQIASQGLDYYKNAIFIGRTNAYTIYQTQVTASNGQAITIATAPPSGSGGLMVGRGFFLTNKLEFLTDPGEWYYDTATKTVYFWTPSGSSPSNYDVRGSVYDYGVHVDTSNYVTVRDLEIAQASSFGIYLDNNSDHAIVNSNSVMNPGLDGIVSFWWSSDSIISNNYIHEANNHAIYLYNNPGAMVTDNEIVGTGRLKNIIRRASGDQRTDNINIHSWGHGIVTYLGNLTITHNRIIDSGSVGIIFGQQAALVRYNYVNGACQVLDDCGGIYTYTGTEVDYDDTTGASGSVVENNIVLNVIGNDDGRTSSAYTAGYGLYKDNATKNVLIQNNTVAGTSGGVFFNPGGFMTFNNNTVTDSSLLMHIAGDFDPNTITNNIFYATARIGSYAAWWSNSHQRIIFTPNTTSAFDFNKYFAHYNTDDVFVNKSGFDQWKLDTGQDANSTFDGSPLGVGETERLIYNDTKIDKTFFVNGAAARDIYNTPITTSFVLTPFTSKIVVGTNLADITETFENLTETKP